MKTPKNVPAQTERGSLLPMLALTLLTAALLFGFMLRSGQLLVAHARAQARTDVVAFSGGVNYARALNVLAASDQALAGAAGLALVTLGTQSQPFFYIQKAQRAGIQVLPWVTAASVPQLGARNGMAALALWNTQSPLPDPRALKPDIHVHQAGVVEKLLGLLGPLGKALPEQAAKDQLNKVQGQLKEKVPQAARAWVAKQLPDVDLDRLVKISYSYKKKGTNQKIDVDPKNVYHRNERQPNGRIKRRAHQRGTDKYLHQEKSFDLDLPLDLEDDGDHALLVASWTPAPKGLGGPWGLLGPPGFANLACVRVAGGSMDALDENATEYGAYFVPLDAELTLEAQGASFLPGPLVLH